VNRAGFEALGFVGYRLTDPDLELLSFLAEHRLVLPTHIAVLLGVSRATATTRLNKLANAGLLKRRPAFPDEPRWYQITHTGLAVIGSSLPAPRVDLRAYEHDVGVAWLWLAARGGTFGALEEIIAERRLRSLDGSRDQGAEPLAVRLGGFGPHGGEKLHYPDLVLRTADGRRVALELELTPKTRTRLETILSGYGADPRFDRVVYLVSSPAVARSVQAAARRLGISELVHLQRVRSTVARTASTAAPAAERTAPRRRRARASEVVR
jgi:DNA-binding MarR family transcriptional regulator